MGKLVALLFGTFGGSTAVCHEGGKGFDNSFHQAVVPLPGRKKKPLWLAAWLDWRSAQQSSVLVNQTQTTGPAECEGCKGVLCVLGVCKYHHRDLLITNQSLIFSFNTFPYMKGTTRSCKIHSKIFFWWFQKSSINFITDKSFLACDARNKNSTLPLFSFIHTHMELPVWWMDFLGRL